MSSGSARPFLLGVVTASLVILAIAGAWTAVQGVAVFDQTRPQPVVIPTVNVRVEQGDLRDVVSGEATSEPGFHVAASAEGVITRDGAKAGQTLRSGDLIGVIDERPLMLFSGSVPAYRDLGPGDVGRDVHALQKALRGLDRYVDPGEVRDMTFGPTTSRAVYGLYRDTGFAPVDADGKPVKATDVKLTGVPRAEMVFAAESSLTAQTRCGTAGQKVAGDLCTLVGGAVRTIVEVPMTEADRLPKGATVRQGDATVGRLGAQVSQPKTPTAEPTGDREPDQTARTTPFTMERAQGVDSGANVEGRVEILVAEATGVSLVDAIALRGSRDAAWLDTSTRGRVDVTVGLCVAGRCEISGVSEGTEVIVPTTVPR